jgi:molecular chaperone GrpE
MTEKEANTQVEENQGPVESREQAASETEDNGLETLQTDLDRFKDLALRSQADLENFRKRAAREKEDGIRYANASLLEQLIPILDNFELGLSAARKESEDSPILAGMQMVLRQLQDFLSANGVQVLDVTGDLFDPNIHEALSQEVSDTVPEGRVIRQLRKGYKLRDRLIRPANVVVSKGNVDG